MDAVVGAADYRTHAAELSLFEIWAAHGDLRISLSRGEADLHRSKMGGGRGSVAALALSYRLEPA
jgi:hypothetical protein